MKDKNREQNGEPDRMKREREREIVIVLERTVGGETSSTRPRLPRDYRG